MYGQSTIPREEEFTTTQRRRIGQRIGHLYRRLVLWRGDGPAPDLSAAEHLICAAWPTWRGHRLGQIALDYWDSLPQTERDVLLAKGDARIRERRRAETIRRVARSVAQERKKQREHLRALPPLPPPAFPLELFVRHLFRPEARPDESPSASPPRHDQQPLLADLLARERPLPPPVEAGDVLWLLDTVDTERQQGRLFETARQMERLRQVFRERPMAPVIPISVATQGDGD